MSRMLIVAALAALAGCGPASNATPPVGANPTLPAPQHAMIPTVKFAKPIGWPDGRTPIAAAGLKVQALALGLDHPRTVLALPNGDVLVAETNGPAAPPPKGFRATAEKVVMGWVGAEVPSPNRITLLHGLKPDGSAARRSIYISGLTSPFGMALVGSNLYVADTGAVLRFPYQPGATSITTPGVKVADLPAFPIDHHWTKTLVASPDGKTRSMSDRLQQQHRRERHPRRDRPRPHPRHRPGHRQGAALRHRPAQRRRPRHRAFHRGALGGGQRARRTGRQPAARLPDLSEGQARFYGWP